MVSEKECEEKGGVLKNGVCRVELDSLYEMQTKLIEHKYPVMGVWELIIAHAGDIYRGLAHSTPDCGYIGEKETRLSRYLDEYTLNTADFEEWRDSVQRMHMGTYLAKKDQYLENLAKLRKATEEAQMDASRKEAMLASLDLIRKLVQWYEESPSAMPYKEWRTLKRTIPQVCESLV